MSPAQLLICLRDCGCTMTANGDVLVVRPRAAITPDIDAAIRQHKPVLLAVAQAATPGQRLPGIVPGLVGDDWREAEALILGTLGFPASARLHAECIDEPNRRRAVLTYLAELVPAAEPAATGGTP